VVVSHALKKRSGDFMPTEKSRAELELLRKKIGAAHDALKAIVTADSADFDQLRVDVYKILPKLIRHERRLISTIGKLGEGEKK